MKRAPGTSGTVSQTVNGKLSKWKARSTAVQATVDIIERSRLAIEDAKIARQDAHIAIAESKAITAMIKSSRDGRRKMD